MTADEIEDAIRAAAALTAAIAERDLGDAEALDRPGPSWCLALWLADALARAGIDPARFAAEIIGDSLEYEAAA